ncbi:signal peptidase I [Candidatus Dojkabacteria bacterium]|uniref:Signal peptidase I n=1 Tax=Candidatus Dojkabacteria bacterium TaxID=2099670 RepID=A0A955I1P4_9BACT|nr:signal peptidase I [Candidatus Dojkabacteria bacterium]MCB9790540.1 signal peptidase I [Candidatus Nomurabacteria bacterium]
MEENKKQVQKDSYEKASGILGALSSFIFESIEGVVIAIAVSVVLFLVLITPHEVIGKSMEPNFVNGEFLFANKLVYRLASPKRGDVIIFEHSPTQNYIKRVIGVPGDTIAVIDGRYYVNDKPLDESQYLSDTVYTSEGTFLNEGESYTLKEDEYFVSGDNRPQSSDSRTFGPVKKDKIIGKAWFIYYPLSQVGLIHAPSYN